MSTTTASTDHADTERRRGEVQAAAQHAPRTADELVAWFDAMDRTDAARLLQLIVTDPKIGELRNRYLWELTRFHTYDEVSEATGASLPAINKAVTAHKKALATASADQPSPTSADINDSNTTTTTKED